MEVPGQDVVYVFGPFRLDARQRMLVRDGEPVELTPRLFDALLFLLENHDRLVQRSELERAIWGDRPLDASGLGKAIAALRKVLQVVDPASNFILTVPGRGYRMGVLVAVEPRCGETKHPAAPVMATGSAPSRGSWLRIILLGVVLLSALAAAWTAGRQFRRNDETANVPAAPVEFAPPAHSIAVLAFTNLSGDPSQDYFADGLSEELIDSLSRVDNLHVAARSSAFSFKNRYPTIDEVARKLNVGRVLEGSVRRDSKRLRVKDAALAGAQRAVSLAPDLAVAHMALGYALGAYRPDFRRQEVEFERARELAPGSAEIAREYSKFEGFAGHPQRALQAAQQAVALDPLKPAAYVALAWNLYYARRPDDALAMLRHARDFGIRETPYLAELAGRIALMQGKPEVARLACHDDTDWETNECLAIAFHALGKPQEAAAELAKLDALGADSGPYSYVVIYAQWGRPGDALTWLEKAYDLPDLGITQIEADPLLDPLRALPRFKAIERKLDVLP